MTAPVIGLTTYGRHETDFKTTHYLEWFAIPTLYVDAVRRAGGVPVLLPPGESNWDALLEILDAVIVIGGGDIHPDYYNGNNAHPQIARLDAERDASELALVKKLAGENPLPTLCICRGMQVANVALGGTLYAHILDQHPQALEHAYYPDWPRDHLAHDIKVAPDSHLAEILEVTDLETNSLHHQGVRVLAPGLRATAWSPDDLIEAFELSEHPFRLAVQWHPEWLTAQVPMRALFKAFVEAAAP